MSDWTAKKKKKGEKARGMFKNIKPKYGKSALDETLEEKQIAKNSDLVN